MSVVPSSTNGGALLLGRELSVECWGLGEGRHPLHAEEGEASKEGASSQKEANQERLLTLGSKLRVVGGAGVGGRG